MPARRVKTLAKNPKKRSHREHRTKKNRKNIRRGDQQAKKDLNKKKSAIRKKQDDRDMKRAMGR